MGLQTRHEHGVCGGPRVGRRAVHNEDAEQCVVVEGLGELPELSFFQADLPNARAFEKWGDFERLKDDLVVELNGQRFEVGQRRKHDKTKVQA